MDEFSKKFQTAFDPLPHFRKIISHIFSSLCSKRPVQRCKICNINLWIEHDPPPLVLFRKFIRFEDSTRPLSKMKDLYDKYAPKMSLTIDARGGEALGSEI